MWNVFIIEEYHLRRIVPKIYRDGTPSEMVKYGMPLNFLSMMNLVIVTDRYEKKIMTVVKNRWINSEYPATEPGIHDLSELSFVLDYYQEMEKIRAKFDGHN